MGTDAVSVNRPTDRWGNRSCAMDVAELEYATALVKARVIRVIGLLIAIAVLVHALLPRYEWRDPGGDNPRVYVRVDRWTGRAQLGEFIHLEGAPAGAWQSYDDLRRFAPAYQITEPTRQLQERANDRARLNRMSADELLQEADRIIGRAPVPK